MDGWLDNIKSLAEEFSAVAGNISDSLDAMYANPAEVSQNARLATAIENSPDDMTVGQLKEQFPELFDNNKTPLGELVAGKDDNAVIQDEKIEAAQAQSFQARTL